MSAIGERCGCGAEFTISDETDWTTAAIDEALENFRTTHLHMLPVEPGRCASFIERELADGSGPRRKRRAHCDLKHGHGGLHEEISAGSSSFWPTEAQDNDITRPEGATS